MFHEIFKILPKKWHGSVQFCGGWSIDITDDEESVEKFHFRKKTENVKIMHV